MTDPSTRLRRTFAYPSSDSDSEVERGLDAHDQATLITDLSRRDTSSTRTYTLLLLAFPLAPALLHIPLLADPSSILTSLLAIASLAASAFALWFLPLPPVKVGVLTVSKEGEVKKRGGNRLSNRDGGGEIGHERPKVPFVPEEVAEVLAKYAVPVNGGVCALLAVLELFKGRSWGDGVVVGGGYLPGLVFGVIMWARRELRVLDLGELERLRKK